MRTTLALLLLATLAACVRPMAWNGPGWYLHMPHVTVHGSDYYGGPMSYDDCEAARKKEDVAHKMLCSLELKQPEQ